MELSETAHPQPSATELSPKPTLQRPEKPRTLDAMVDPTVFEWSSVMPKLVTERGQGKTIVVTNGHFVLFHPGHSASLEQAREVGKLIRQDHSNDGVVLLAVVNNDTQTRLKDPVKAVAQNARERALNVLDNRHSDYVVVSEAPDDDRTLVSDFQKMAEAGVISDQFIYVKGGDYNTDANLPPEAKIVTEHGGKFVIVNRVGDYSTSNLTSKMMGAMQTQGR